MTPSTSPFAPLRHAWFRLLWSGIALAYVGGWVQVVGAQWALVTAPDAGAAVALVPTAALLPIMLLWIPARIFADAVDPRMLMILISVYGFLLIGILGVLSALGHATAGVLVIFTFGFGVGAALLLPAWRVVVRELVPADLEAASRLDLLSFDVARILGPVIAGLVIATSGVWNAFALAAFAVVFVGGLALLWPRSVGRARADDRQGPTLSTVLAGGRRDPALQGRLLRTVLFAGPAAAWWALLPLATRDRLGYGATGYGLLLAACGVGAFLARPLVARLRVSPRVVSAGAGFVFAAAMVAIEWLPAVRIAPLVCCLAGLAWITTTRSLGCEIVGASEGSSLPPITFAGSMAIASVLWGQLAELIGVPWTFLVAAVAVLAGVVVGFVVRDPSTDA